MITLCRYQGICGMPIGHDGEHVPDHALVQCINPFECSLCLQRSAGRLVRYGLTPADLTSIVRQQREVNDARRSAAGCINCPICHFDPMVTSEIIGEHARLYWLEMWAWRAAPPASPSQPPGHA